MIQFPYNGQGSVNFCSVSVNIYSINLSVPEMFIFKPLIGLTSQQTRKSIYVLPFVSGYAINGRDVQFGFGSGLNFPTLGWIIIGNYDYPLGLYDVNIYYNTSDGNLDPTGQILMWSGLMNFYPADSDHANVQYVPYTNNDSDTDHVYITAE
mgnify:CR=1 FL=1|tara:strand:+ start:3651 stop:4106 length:456 start_codon:yes stop_codon:yes gene_type:complete